MAIDYLLFSIWLKSRDLKATALAQERDDRIDEMPLGTSGIALLGSSVSIQPMSLLPERTTMTWPTVVDSLLPFRKKL